MGDNVWFATSQHDTEEARRSGFNGTPFRIVEGVEWDGSSRDGDGNPSMGESKIFGIGTANPIGFTRDQLMQLVWRIRRISLDASFGSISTPGALELQADGDGAYCGRSKGTTWEGDEFDGSETAFDTSSDLLSSEKKIITDKTGFAISYETQPGIYTSKSLLLSVRINTVLANSTWDLFYPGIVFSAYRDFSESALGAEASTVFTSPDDYLNLDVGGDLTGSRYGGVIGSLVMTGFGPEISIPIHGWGYSSYFEREDITDIPLPESASATAAVVDFWPYATKTGSPVWDTSTGAQLNDPCS